MNWNNDGTFARSVKGLWCYRIKQQYVPEPGVEEERYLVFYQPAGDPNGKFIDILDPYKTLEEAQRACEKQDEADSRNLGL